MKHLFEQYTALTPISISDGYSTFLNQLDNQQKDIKKCGYEINTDYKTQIFDPDIDIDLSEDHFHLSKDGWIFDILMTRHQDKRLFVLFGAARTLTRKNPYTFTRWSYFPFMSGNVLSIIDPMYYKYPNLKLGWYYGTKDYCLLQTIAAIIKKIQLQLHISDTNITFIGSSGGGYTALEISKYFSGTTHIAINPQIRIARHRYSDEFRRITNVDLNSYDSYGRNTTDNFISKNKDCTYVIIQNARDNHQCAEHLFPFLQGKGISSLQLCINRFDNLTIWLYNCFDKKNNAHNYVGDQFIFSLMLLLQHIKELKAPLIEFLYKNISLQLYQKSVAEALSGAPQLLGTQPRQLREWLLFFSRLPRDIQMERLQEILHTAQQECGQDPRLALTALRAYITMWISYSLPVTAAPWRMLPACLSEILSFLPYKWSIALLEKSRRTNPSHIMGNLFLAWAYHYYRNASREYTVQGMDILKNISAQEIPDCGQGFAVHLYLKYSLVDKARQLLYKKITNTATLPAEVRLAFAAATMSQKAEDAPYMLYNLTNNPCQIEIRGINTLVLWDTMRQKGGELPQFFFPRQGYPLELKLYDIPLYFRNVQHARLCLAPVFPNFLAEARENPEYWQQTLAVSRICRMEDNVALCAWEMFKLRLLTPQHMRELEAEGFQKSLAGLQAIIGRFVKTHGNKNSS